MDPLDDRTELLLIRHAQSEWNASGLWQGQADVPLSESGREQALGLARSLEGELSKRQGTPLYSSDLARALETARAVGAVAGLEPRPLPGLRELDVGTWSGLTRSEIEARDPALLARFERDDPDARPGGGETRREIRARAHAVVEQIVREHPGAPRIVIVTHLGFLRALLPGVEPANAGVLRVGAREALMARQRHETQGGPRVAAPL